MSKPFAFFLALLASTLLAGCNWTDGSSSSGSGGTSAPPAAPQPRVDDSQFLARAAHVAEVEGQTTLNNPWTAQDTAGNEIDHIDWRQTRENFRWLGTTYTTLVSQYRERRKQCEIDSQVTYRQRYPNGPFGTGETDSPDFPICHPTLANLTDAHDEDGNPIDCLQVMAAAKGWTPPGPRYGYWCGAGHPPFGAGSDLAPQPLDAVDFCCMLHDARVWGTGGADSLGRNNETERGMSMCLYMATQYPAGTMSKLPDVEESRQFWYRCTGWASYGNQFDDAPEPVVRR